MLLVLVVMVLTGMFSSLMGDVTILSVLSHTSAKMIDTGSLLAIMVPLIIAIITGVWILGGVNTTVRNSAVDISEIKTHQASMTANLATAFEDITQLKNDVRTLQTDVALLKNHRDKMDHL